MPSMIQFAVARQNTDWTVYRDGAPIEEGLTRSAAIELANRLAFVAEEGGDTVETLIQSYYGEMSRKLTGATED